MLASQELGFDLRLLAGLRMLAGVSRPSGSLDSFPRSFFVVARDCDARYETSVGQVVLRESSQKGKCICL
jgi:hypothetical protein